MIGDILDVHLLWCGSSYWVILQYWTCWAIIRHLMTWTKRYNSCSLYILFSLYITLYWSGITVRSSRSTWKVKRFSYLYLYIINLWFWKKSFKEATAIRQFFCNIYLEVSLMSCAWKPTKEPIASHTVKKYNQPQTDNNVANKNKRYGQKWGT